MPALNRNIYKQGFGIAYWICVLILCLPLFAVEYFITHDGPSHMYNSMLIREYIYGNEVVRSFLVLKSFPEPNWTGHFILSILTAFISPAIAEKILVGGFMLMFAYFFSRLGNKINPQSQAMQFLALPFIYCNFLFLGVYNFLIGITLMFGALSLILTSVNTKSLRLYVIILFTGLILYFSHLLAWGVFVLLLFLILFYSRRFEAKTLMKCFFALLPSVILVAIFLFGKVEINTSHTVIPLSQLLQFLYEIRPLITLTYHPENIFSAVIFFLILFVILFALFSRRYRKAGEFYKRSSFWLIVTIIMLVLYFIVPDEAATGGVVKFRFEYLFYLFLVIMSFTFNFPQWLKVFTALIITTWIILKVNYMMPMMKSLDSDTKLAMQMIDHLEENSVVLTLNYSANWMHGNILNYTGAYKKMIMLDNYEAVTPHFPVEWRKDKNPVLHMGNLGKIPPVCLDIGKYENVSTEKTDYIILWHYADQSDSCSSEIKKFVDRNFFLKHKEPLFQVYKRK